MYVHTYAYSDIIRNMSAGDLTDIRSYACVCSIDDYFNPVIIIFHYNTNEFSTTI